MLTTAMTTQISAIMTTWAVLTELVLVIRDARNEPKSSTALGATPLDCQECSVTAVAPMPSPIEPRPMARFVHAATLGWMPRCASLASTCLSISYWAAARGVDTGRPAGTCEHTSDYH